MIAYIDIDTYNVPQAVKDIFNLLDGHNMANSLLNEPTAKIGFDSNPSCYYLNGNNYRINIYKTIKKIEFIYAEKLVPNDAAILVEKMKPQISGWMIREISGIPGLFKIAIQLSQDSYISELANLLDVIVIK